MPQLPLLATKYVLYINMCSTPRSQKAASFLVWHFLLKQDYMETYSEVTEITDLSA